MKSRPGLRIEGNGKLLGRLRAIWESWVLVVAERVTLIAKLKQVKRVSWGGTLSYKRIFKLTFRNSRIIYVTVNASIWIQKKITIPIRKQCSPHLHFFNENCVI